MGPGRGLDQIDSSPAFCPRGCLLLLCCSRQLDLGITVLLVSEARDFRQVGICHATKTRTTLVAAVETVVAVRARA